MTFMQELIEHWDLSDMPIDWVSNAFGWPCIFGLGDEAASHPVESSHDMIWFPNGLTPFWDERLQIEYGI